MVMFLPCSLAWLSASGFFWKGRLSVSCTLSLWIGGTDLLPLILLVVAGGFLPPDAPSGSVLVVRVAAEAMVAVLRARVPLVL